MSYIGVSLAVSNSRPIGSPSLSDLVGFWDADTANVVYVVDNGGLDARKTSGNEQWGDSVSVTSVTLTSVDQYEIDIEVVTKESGNRDNFGILVTSAVGTVPVTGFLRKTSQVAIMGGNPSQAYLMGTLLRYDLMVQIQN